VRVLPSKNRFVGLPRILANPTNPARLDMDIEDVANLGYGKHQQLLLCWCNAVCCLYDMKIRNFTTAFSDGRALCFLVHHYQPNLLPVDNILTLTTHTYAYEADQEITAEEASVIKTQLLSNEEHNFNYKLALKKMSELV
jgi:hypothetical protein